MADEITQFQLERRKSPVKLIIGIILVILAVGAGIYLYVTPAEKLPEIITPAAAKEIPSVSIVFASSIDNNLNYVPQQNKEYYENNPLFVYAEVSEFSQDSNFNADISEDIEVRDSQNNAVFAQSNFAVLKKKYDRKIPFVGVSNTIKTAGWKPGNYVLNLRINDNIAKKSTMKSADFVIKKIPSNQFIATVDLSGIITNSDSSSDLTRTQIVKDSAGKIISGLNGTQKVNADLSKLNLKYIEASFTMPERFDAGTYSVKITYTNIKTGKSVSAEGSVVLEKKLAVSDFVFASIVNDDYSYTAQPNKEYESNDNLYVYLKLINFAQPFAKGNYSVKFTEDIYILDKQGNEYGSQKAYLSVNDLSPVKKDGYAVKNVFALSDMAKGEYLYKVIVKDLISGQEAIKEEVFSIG